ncbi:hypothetical protein [Paenarthrobacter ureafaciens]|uniref:hypothetical protein n=1 Tax=Paenarthrobacter ureafaciens TaxID=37931 RepID=UPI001FB4CA8A|nr:hypothetical protein [Paenarthrobacter ureafaciens]UOD81739.1 hypothetical protein MQZ73_02290 [Paenarthrobacter ureafaciens]WNZ05230.1 hypothetical protein PVT25_06835 [Paenarthrobacter ureafaciens]
MGLSGQVVVERAGTPGAAAAMDAEAGLVWVELVWQSRRRGQTTWGRHPVSLLQTAVALPAPAVPAPLTRPALAVLTAVSLPASAVLPVTWACPKAWVFLMAAVGSLRM